jgi:formylglycine-generating enzyme required for sulfatase activity
MSETPNKANPRWIIIGTAVLGLIAALFIVVAKYYEIHRARAEAEKAQAEAERVKSPPVPITSPTDKPAKYFTNSIGMKFVWIPPGSFLMGSSKEEGGRSDNENRHKVTLTKGFYMGLYTVTQEQWQAVMGNNPSKFKGENNLPVEMVSWDDCQEFIKNLREIDNKPYRLPTEAEWEYACRAGRTTPFNYGQTISTDQANYRGTESYGNGKKGVYRKKLTPVGSFPPNAFGLYDMHGNVWQWCQDWLGDYSQKDVVDPQGPEKGEKRVLRAGSWTTLPGDCRSAHRGRDESGGRTSRVGFRFCF